MGGQMRYIQLGNPEGKKVMATQTGAEQVSATMIRDYAEGRLSWSRLRETTGVEDFGVVLRRLGEEGLKLPRAPRERPSRAREWLREALTGAGGRGDGVRNRDRVPFDQQDAGDDAGAR